MTVADILALALAAGALVATVLAIVGTRRSLPALILPGVAVVVASIIVTALGGDEPSSAASLVSAIMFAALGTVGGSPAVALVLRWATKGAVPLGEHGGILVRAPGETQPRPRSSAWRCDHRLPREDRAHRLRARGRGRGDRRHRRHQRSRSLLGARDERGAGAIHHRHPHEPHVGGGCGRRDGRRLVEAGGAPSAVDGVGAGLRFVGTGSRSGGRGG